MRLHLLALVALVACGDRINDEDAAEIAYVGLDRAVEKAINLGMDGYSAASSANIPEQQAAGDLSGTMTVNGQVDQGSSDNKGLRLDVVLVDYADVNTFGEEDEEEELEIVYDTVDDTPAAVDMSLRDIPDGTFTGTLVGDFVMEGDLEGEVSLNLALAGEIETDPDVEGGIRRVEGTTTITGTATSEYGEYTIDLVR